MAIDESQDRSAREHIAASWPPTTTETLPAILAGEGHTIRAVYRGNLMI